VGIFAADTDASEPSVTRSIPPSLAPVLERLELEDARLVTTQTLAELLRDAGVRTAPRTVAKRLRDRGWLLATDQRGVWEFAPAALAGAYSRTGPTRLLQAVLARRDVRCALTFQAAAWSLGLASRVPSILEVAAATRRDADLLPTGLDVSVFVPHVAPQVAKGVPTMGPASVLVHMASAPNRVRSWTSAVEWLPDLAAECARDEVLGELEGRPATVRARAGYLVQALRPDIADRLERPVHKTWFGPRGKLKRHDSRWLVADTALPLDPRLFDSVA
jgi:hypothetical protein